jgi:membrane protease YdiL (CAAX protease family)
MPGPTWIWRPAPGWPPPPPGWVPPAGWNPPPSWPPPPPDWQFWMAVDAPVDTRVVEVRLDEPTRQSLARETRWVMVAFLLPTVTSAIVPLVQHAEGVSDINRFPVVVPGQALTNMLLGILLYTAVGAMVPLTLFLLARTGQSARELGLGFPSWRTDIVPGIGLAAASFGTEIVLLIPFTPLLMHKSLVVEPTINHVPAYYVVYALSLSAITAITEEVMVNGYLLTRLEQLGWSPRRALVLSMVLRTSYHIYYGLAVFLTIPFAYYVTRSFQRNRRLNRPIAAHFLFDAVLTTIAVLR